MYQVFSRRWTVSKCGRPRRVCTVHDYASARRLCKARNTRLTAKESREGFKYEFAELGWYNDAFGR